MSPTFCTNTEVLLEHTEVTECCHYTPVTHGPSIQSAKLTFISLSFCRHSGHGSSHLHGPPSIFKAQVLPKYFHQNFCLGYQFMSTFYKYTGRGDSIVGKKQIVHCILGSQFYIYVCIQFIDISGHRQLKVHKPPNFFIAFVRCL